ncbi:MAG: S24/S26 family peptidase [Clostridia bacterium]|nr:S24/S26 family peptidase [Clostridia bacterium]
MEENKKKVRLSQMLPLIEEKLSSGGEISIPVTGVSMNPTLKAGRDYVVLEKAPDKLKKYDIPLCRRDDGSFVLHRVVGEDENGYILLGDNQKDKEYGIRHDMIVGLTVAVERDGKRIPVKSLRYKPNGVFRDEIYYMRKAKYRVKKTIWKIVNGKKD